jgi:hypothetical protein
MVPLGRLELVDPRSAWPDEAANFTPWLAEDANLGQLAESLGLSLELEAVEKQVGPFAADILAKDIATNSWVLIENQIEPTDHRHLGQLLTYAAGLDTRIIVWIAKSFRDEHRAAVDFLNKATTQDFSFFAEEIELYKIGDSPFAPRFSVVAKPNGWRKQVQQGKQAAEGELTESQKLYKEYWGKLISSGKVHYPAIAGLNPWQQNTQGLEKLRVSNPPVRLNATFSWDKGLRLEVYMDGVLAKAAFKKLQDSRDAIESEFGEPLAWEELPQAQASRISFYMPGNQKPHNPAQWQAQHDWLLTWAPKLAAAVRPFVTSLDPQDLNNSNDVDQ